MAIDKAVFFLPKIFLAAHILWVDFKIINKLVQWVGLTFEKAGFSETLLPFLSSILSIALKGAVLFTIATIIGADRTGLAAILAVAGFDVVMALQGSPGNFTSGF